MSRPSSNILPWVLLKFGEREHLEEFRREGLLYMNPLAYFLKLESDAERGDSFEGATWIYQPKHVEIVSDTGGIGLGKFVAREPDSAGPVRIALGRTAACNVYCMFAVTKPVDGELVNSENLKFGNSVVAVLNVGEFLNRIASAARDAGLSSEAGLVEYYDEEGYSGETGRFRKRSKFAHQQEFRIVVEPGCAGPRRIVVGSLLDITSEVLPSSEANQRFDFSKRSAREAGLVR